MKGTIRRLLRIRRLGEELARASLERESMRLREVERGVEGKLREVAQAVEVRGRAMREGDQAGFLLAEAEREIAGMHRSRLEGMRRRQTERIPPLSERFLDSRVERRQVEALDGAEQRLAEEMQLRKEQAALDEWFRGQMRRQRKAIEPGDTVEASTSIELP